jgi:hypothetical protein
LIEEIGIIAYIVLLMFYLKKGERNDKKRRCVVKKTGNENVLLNAAETRPRPGLSRPGLSIDWDLYLAHLEESDLSEEQKREFIQTLWSIVVSFVDLGFGIHPLQQALPDDSEQLPDMSEILASDLGRVVCSKHQISETEFSKVAGHELHGRGEGNES